MRGAAAVKRLPADSQARQLERACILNLAQVSLRVEDWHACVACCNEILNSESVCKAFFRRGLAYAELELFGKAVKDVKEAARLEPANKEIRNVLDEIRQKWDEWKMRQRLPAPPPPPVHDLDALPEVWAERKEVQVSLRLHETSYFYFGLVLGYIDADLWK